MLDRISGDYVADVTFLGVAGRSSLEATTAGAARLIPSGNILWGLDQELAVWEAFGVRTQPITFLISSRGQILETWYGIRGESETRAAIEMLIENA